jgi:hypothetical protein
LINYLRESSGRGMVTSDLIARQGVPMADTDSTAGQHSSRKGRETEPRQLEQLHVIGATARHYAEQLSTQARAGDPCIDKILAYKDADAAYHDAVHMSWEARLMHTVFYNQQRYDIQVRSHAILPSEVEQADRAIAEDQKHIDRADKLTREYDAQAGAARVARHKAIEALKECRKHHPYEHECGERGGPGIRRPDGKCAAWADLEGGPEVVLGGD